MKKNLFYIAALAIAMVSCSSDDVLVDNVATDNTQAEIGFSTYTKGQTRAENSSMTTKTDLEAHHENFKVWGAKVAGTPATHQAVWAAATPGTVSYSSSAWTVNPLKFWDKSASTYYFYAAAPASPSWALAFTSAEDMSDATITLENYKLTGVNVRTAASATATDSWKTNGGADLDLLVASPCPFLRANYNKATPDKVNLEFNHILSRLNVLVKKGTSVSGSTVNLTGLQVFNLKNKGSFNEKPASLTSTQLAAGTVARWATPTVDGTYTPTAIALSGVTTTAQYVLETLIIPQEITFEDIDVNGSSSNAQAYLRIDYTIDGEKFYGFYNLAKAFAAASGNIAFNEGWQNNLTITIAPAAIEFDAEVFDWDTNKDENINVPD